MTMPGVDLLPRERIVWEGRPVRGQLLRPADVLRIPFSIVWFLSALWILSPGLVSPFFTDRGADQPAFPDVFGYLFLGTGVCRLPPPVLNERPDWSGSLAFGAFPSVWGGFTGRSAWFSDPPHDVPVLWNIPDVRRVRDLVANAQARRPEPR